jgi:hypothetical protein
MTVGWLTARGVTDIGIKNSILIDDRLNQQLGIDVETYDKAFLERYSIALLWYGRRPVKMPSAEPLMKYVAHSRAYR